MSDSGFNMGTTAGDEAVREIPLPIRSGRYLYFKTTRHGLLNFVKRPSPEYTGDMLTVEALRKEFLLCFPLSHPSLVRYIAFENSSLYEEYVGGMTLREMIDCNDGRLRNPRFLLSFARQLFNVLDYIHRQGILHLDIKPENLMITRIGNTLKLIDFSCATSAVSDKTAGFTPGYKAPEQGEGVDSCATDLYLAGKVIELLAQKGLASHKWKSFISKAIASDPSLRFQSAEEALEALPSKVGRKIPVYFYLGGITLMLIVGAIILWLNYKQDPSPKTFEPVIPQNITDTSYVVGDIISTPSTFNETSTPPQDEIRTSAPSSRQKSEATSFHESPSMPEGAFPDHIYIIGNVEGNRLDPMNGILMHGKNGIYTGVFEFTKSTNDGHSYFLLSEKLGDSWDRAGSVWSSNTKKMGNSEIIQIEEGESTQYSTREGSSNPFKLNPGKYAVKFDLKNSRLTVTRRSN